MYNISIIDTFIVKKCCLVCMSQTQKMTNHKIQKRIKFCYLVDCNISNKIFITLYIYINTTTVKMETVLITIFISWNNQLTRKVQYEPRRTKTRWIAWIRLYLTTKDISRLFVSVIRSIRFDEYVGGWYGKNIYVHMPSNRPLFEKPSPIMSLFLLDKLS